MYIAATQCNIRERALSGLSIDTLPMLVGIIVTLNLPCSSVMFDKQAWLFAHEGNI